MAVLGGGRYSNGFVDQFWCGLAVSDPKSDHPDPFWYIFHQKTCFLYSFWYIFRQKLVFWTFQALWSWAAFLAGAFFLLKKLTFGLPNPNKCTFQARLVQARPVSVDQTHCLCVENTQSPVRAGGAGGRIRRKSGLAGSSIHP